MAIDRTDLTKGEVAGSGLFDELMRTTKAHLKDEYDKGRIHGTDYSNVYLGSLQSNLSVASAFLLQNEITNQQVLLLKEHIEQGEKQNELLDLQKEQLRIANLTAQYNLDNILPEQLEGMKQQRLLAVEQVANAKKQGLLLDKQLEQADKQISIMEKQEQLLEEQIKTENANTQNPTGGLTKAQLDRTTKENLILDQKLITEKAQTEGNETDTYGLIGQEMKLKGAQADSFTRDAEQKAAKFYADVLSIAYSTDPTNVDPDAWNLGPTESFKVMNKVLEGIGVSVQN